jgi:Ca2+-binding EF-hand superfamily protein
MIVELLTGVSVYFKNVLSNGVEFNFHIDDLSLLSSVQRFVSFIQIVKTIDSNKYPNGKNYVFQMMQKEDFEYFSVKNRVKSRKINELYKDYKKIEYNDSKNDKILIDNQNSLNYSMLDSTHFIYQQQMKSLQLLGKPISEPLVIPQVEIKFIVSELPAPHNMTAYQTNYDDMSHQFLNQKDQLLRELSSNYGLSVPELEAIHLDFSRFTTNRRVDGRLNRFEFHNMLTSKGITKRSFVQQLFEGLDEFHNGFVLFRSYVAGVSALRSSFVDRKLLIVFNAFCNKEYGFLYKSDLFDMVAANDPGLTGSLEGLVNQVFEIYDQDRDGKLSFNEFKMVVNAKAFMLDSLWIEFSLNYSKNMTLCGQCGLETPVKEGRGLPICHACVGYSGRGFYV